MCVPLQVIRHPYTLDPSPVYGPVVLNTNGLMGLESRIYGKGRFSLVVKNLCPD